MEERREAMKVGLEGRVSGVSWRVGAAECLCVCKLTPSRPPAVARLRVLKGLGRIRSELILILFLTDEGEVQLILLD